jgi:hypothetical protein
LKKFEEVLENEFSTFLWALLHFLHGEGQIWEMEIKI